MYNTVTKTWNKRNECSNQKSILFQIELYKTNTISMLSVAFKHQQAFYYQDFVYRAVLDLMFAKFLHIGPLWSK